MYRSVPEDRFSAGYVGNTMAGATLFAGRRRKDRTIEPAPASQRASEIVSQIAGGPDGRSKLLGDFGRHLSGPGESWIVVRPNSEALNPGVPEDDHDWRVQSMREVSQKSGRLAAEFDGEDIEIPPGDEEILDPDDAACLAGEKQLLASA